METLNFGIQIDIGGNVNSASNQAAASLNRVGSAVSNLGQASHDSLGNLLALQSSLFVLTKAGRILQNFGYGVTENLVKGFYEGVKSSGELEQSLSFLRIAAGKDFETAAASVRKLAVNTNLSFQDTVDVSRRMISAGLQINQIFGKAAKTSSTGIEVVSGALAALSGMDRVRALNSIGNAFEDINSAARLFNVTATQADKIKFSSALTAADRAVVVLQFLERNYKNVFGANGVGTNLIFNITRAVQNLQLFIQEAFMPIRTLLTPAFMELNTQFEKLVTNTVFMKNISNILLDFGKIALFAVHAVSSLVDWVVKFVSNNPKLAEFALFATLIGSILIGLLGTFILVGGSLALFGLSIFKVIGYIVGGNFASSAWVFTLGLLDKALNFLYLDAFKKSLIALPTLFEGVIAGTVSWGTAILGLGTALLTILTPILLVFAAFKAWDALPSFFAGFNSVLGITLQLLKLISAIIVGLVVGTLTGNPLLGIAAGLGTFAAFEKFLPNPTVKGTQEKAPDLSTFSNASTAKSTQDLENLRHQFEIQNNIILDGQVISRSVNKINKNEEDRFSLSGTKPYL